MFSRLFSILTDMSLSEYVRLRKLTRAAMDIREGQAKIIDIALKYGYESSDSFAFAFKQFHQILLVKCVRGCLLRSSYPCNYH